MKSLISKVLNKIVFILIKLNIIKPKSIFYMGGVNILPPPLSAEEEMELLQQLETDDSIKQILIERNLRLVVYISRKFENTGIDIEDLISIGTIGLIKAVNTFKLNKNIKLATYASRCIENEILMYLRKNNKKKIEVSFDEPLNIDVDGNELLLSDVLGTENVLTAAIECGVKKVVCLSTDKAAYPVNAMGTSKAMMEKVIVAKSRTVDPDKTSIMCTRYGNVLASRGSVVPLFINQIKEGNDLTVTEPSMTRFVMTLEEAVDLVLFAFEHGESGDIFVQKAPACTIEVLAKAVQQLFHAENDIKVIGIRHGEKMYETLLTDEECAHAIDMGDFYRVPADKRDLNYDKYFSEGMETSKLTQFNSNNTKLMDIEAVKNKLLEVKLVREELEGWDK